MKLIVALLLLLMAAGCSTAPTAADSNLQAMAAALLQNQLSSQTTYLRQNSKQKLFVSVGAEDLSAATIAKLSDQGVTMLPGSAWHEGSGMRMGIGPPAPRPDGDYDVTYSYYCGVRCTSVHQAVMSKGEHGWSVISSKLVLIGFVPAGDRPRYPASN